MSGPWKDQKHAGLVGAQCSFVRFLSQGEIRSEYVDITSIAGSTRRKETPEEPQPQRLQKVSKGREALRGWTSLTFLLGGETGFCWRKS